jgi:serine protease Do
MQSQIFSRVTSRIVASSLLCLQATLGTISIQEALKNNPNLSSGYTAQARSSHNNANEIYQKVQPSIVYITAKLKNGMSQGSGVIINADGLLVTNAHVIEGSNKITVELSDGRSIRAEVVSRGHGECNDLALLRLPNQTNLPALKFANLNDSQIGHTVFSIGFPQDTKPASITEGIISNIHTQQGLLQTSAFTIGGSSGGALVNEKGELLGINTFIWKNSSFAFAININRVQLLTQAIQQNLTPTLGRYVLSNSNSPINLEANGIAIEGDLAQNDALVCSDQSAADIYTFHAEANQSVILEMSSDALNPYMMLLGPDGQLLAESEQGEDKTTRLYGKIPAKGTYTIVANSQKANQQGRYAIRAVTPMLLHQGKLSAGGTQTYSFSGVANQQIAIDVNGQGFQPHIQLVDSTQRILWAGKWDATVELTLPQNGAYHLIVSTDDQKKGGEFLAIVQPKPPVTNVANR